MKQLLSFDECKQMSSRLIAMNPNRNANMGKISTFLLDYYTELTQAALALSARRTDSRPYRQAGGDEGGRNLPAVG